MSENLKNKTAKGIFWSAFQRYSSILIKFISGIILARLLTPHDYGCIGMLTIFMVLSEAFIDAGFGDALIQKKRPTQEDYSTIFYWNVFMAIVMYVVLYMSAPAIASFYNIPLLTSILRVQGIVLFIYAFNIIQRNQLRKKMNFKLLSLVTIITSVSSLSVTVYLAYSGFGVWSLVAQNIIGAAIPALFYWFYIKWRPTFVFSWQSFRELFSFGFFMFMTNMLNQIGHQIQGLLIGRFYNSSTMGLYAKADSSERLVSTGISQVLTQVTFPLYAEVQDDKSKLSSIIRRLTITLSYLAFPLIFVVMLCAKPIFIFLYSDRWVDSVPYFQVLCFAGLAYSLQAVNHQSISAIGKSRVMFSWTFVKRIMGILFVVAGLYYYGMTGLLVGMVINTWFSYIVNISLVSKYVGYKWWNQLLDIFPIICASCIAAAISYYTCATLNLPLYEDGLLKLIIFATIYIGWSVIFKPESYGFFLSVVDPLSKKIKDKRHK